jgi:hypothetical protein
MHFLPLVNFLCSELARDVKKNDKTNKSKAAYQNRRWAPDEIEK